MTDLGVLDRAHVAINTRMIATGQAPHYGELVCRARRGRDFVSWWTEWRARQPR